MLQLFAGAATKLRRYETGPSGHASMSGTGRRSPVTLSLTTSGTRVGSRLRRTSASAIVYLGRLTLRSFVLHRPPLVNGALMAHSSNGGRSVSVMVITLEDLP